MTPLNAVKYIKKSSKKCPKPTYGGLDCFEPSSPTPVFCTGLRGWSGRGPLLLRLLRERGGSEGILRRMLRKAVVALRKSVVYCGLIRCLQEHVVVAGERVVVGTRVQENVLRSVPTT